jgi:hypothetical protein
MSLVMSATRMIGRTPVGIGRVDLERMFIYMIGVRVMQVAVMQIICMAGVGESHMAARRSMLVSVILMLRASAHRDLLA